MVLLQAAVLNRASAFGDLWNTILGQGGTAQRRPSGQAVGATQDQRSCTHSTVLLGAGVSAALRCALHAASLILPVIEQQAQHSLNVGKIIDHPRSAGCLQGRSVKRASSHSEAARTVRDCALHIRWCITDNHNPIRADCLANQSLVFGDCHRKQRVAIRGVTA